MHLTILLLILIALAGTYTNGQTVMRTTAADCYLVSTSSSTTDVSGSYVRFWTPSGSYTEGESITIDYNLVNFPLDQAWNWQVHDFGDVISSDASAISGILPGVASDPDLTSGVGDLGYYFQPTTVNGAAMGSTSNNQIALNGVNSIIGRTLIFLQPSPPSQKVAMCVIGKAAESDAEVITGEPTTLRAGCLLTTTSVSTNPAISGYFSFEVTTAGLQINYYLSGLTDGNHFAHIHQFGNISQSNGQSVGNHFIGTCTNCRPSGLQEVGAIGNTMVMVSKNGMAVGSFVDTVAKMDTLVNDIVGRAVVVHGDFVPTSTAREAQCVIGRLIDSSTPLPPIPPAPTTPWTTHYYTTSAVALLEPVRGSNVTGIVEIHRQPSTLNLEFRYIISGLTPGNHLIHVHTNGDMTSGDASFAGGHYPGNCPATSCRGIYAPEQNAGFLSNGTAIVANSMGVAKGRIVDTVMRFHGVNSVIARSIVVHTDPTGSTARVAQGAIGKMSEINDGSTLYDDFVNVTSAVCRFKSVSTSPTKIGGYISFTPNADGNYTIKWYVTGLTDAQNHSFHVHLLGNILDQDNAEATTGHFVGSAPTRPGFLSEVGSIPAYMVSFASTNSIATGSLNHQYIKLMGDNGILSRAVVIHGNGTSASQRVAECVIGAKFMPSYTLVKQAICKLEPTRLSTSPTLNGTVVFTAPSGPLNSWESQSIQVDYVLNSFGIDGAWTFHVHELGDILGDDGNSVEGHYIGYPYSRSEVGNFMQTVTISGGAAEGTFWDTEVGLNGMDTIIGRAIVFHSPAGTRMGQCVIGINIEEPVQNFETQPIATTAVVRIINTGISTNTIQGHMRFQNTSSGLYVSYFIYGLVDGQHMVHVHSAGNINCGDGSCTGGHFAGTCNSCRPPNLAQEVGQIGNGYMIWSVNGVATGSFYDYVLTLEQNGVNGMMGRAITIHGQVGDSDARVAFGVIGKLMDNYDLLPWPLQPAMTSVQTHYAVTSAVAIITPAAVNATAPLSTVHGYVEFIQWPQSSLMQIRYFLTGLSNGNHGLHVHTFGDISDRGGEFAGGHLPGDCPLTMCRGAFATEQNAGYILNGTKIVANSWGVARGTLMDTVLSFNGQDSIVGRGVVVHGLSSSLPSTVRVGQGVIGRTSDYANWMTLYDDFAYYVEGASNSPLSAAAIVQFAPVLQDGDADDNIWGWMTFIEVEPIGSSGMVNISYAVWGLIDGNHNVHVHLWGNTLDNELAESTGGHFIGVPPPNRGNLPNETGWIPTVIVSSGGMASGWVVDNFITLRGDSSVIGRAVVIHGNATSSTARVASGVIGVANATRLAPSEAAAYMPTTSAIHPSHSAKKGDKAPSKGGKGGKGGGGSGSSSSTNLGVGLGIGLGGSFLLVVGLFYMKNRRSGRGNEKEMQ